MIYGLGASAKLCMMSGQSSSPVMHDACEDLGQNYLKADIIQILALPDTKATAVLGLVVLSATMRHHKVEVWSDRCSARARRVSADCVCVVRTCSSNIESERTSETVTVLLYSPRPETLRS